MEGEALFNDGMAIVVFTCSWTLVTGRTAPCRCRRRPPCYSPGRRSEAWPSAWPWAISAILVIKTIDDYPVEILITLALVAGGYAGADALGTSGPLAMVTAGIVIGNHARARVMSSAHHENLDRFWEMVDIILNAVLFVLIGLEAVVFAAQFSLIRFLVSLAAIVIVLAARFVSVALPLVAFRPVSGVGAASPPS